MAYTIRLTNGNTFATINDGTVNTASSMTLVGKNYAGYGQFLDDNFIRLLESNANSTAPPTQLTGQLWWDSANKLLKIYNGTVWKSLGMLASGTAPASNGTGDLWYDTTNQQLKVYTVASEWQVVGPAFSSSQGTSGAIPLSITDDGGVPHVVTGMYANGTLVSVTSNDATFTPNSAFSTIFPRVFKGVTVYNTGVTSGNISNPGNTTITSAGVTVANFANTGAFITGVTNVTATITGGNVVTGGLISAAGNITGSNASIAGTITVANLIVTNSLINQSSGPTVFSGNVNPSANAIYVIGNATNRWNSITSVGANFNTVGVSGNIDTGNLRTAGQVTAIGNVVGGNIVTGGLISATGNITAGNVSSVGNIAATFFTGNGSQLTGLSLGVSVTKIENGMSEAAIDAPGGNISFTVAGAPNVAVVTTTGVVVVGLSTPSITKTGTNAVGNIGSAGSFFNTVFAATAAVGVVSASGNVTGNFFFGNGSLLTGVDATSIQNGNSNVRVVGSGSAVTVGVGGTANVAVFATTGLAVTGLSTPSITKTGSNSVGNIGSSSNYFNQVFATATTALYADVAERFAADELLSPGTVVELGGSKEITRSVTDLSENVFGVISTRPAYTMNGGAGEDDTHPKVAMTGRVPVKVVGYVRKGDRLVSAGNGVARAAAAGEATAFNVIGRSLVDKVTPESGTIEAIVTINN